MPVTEEKLPASLEVERLVLGGALVSGIDMDAIRSQLGADDFSLEKHRKIWQRICGLYDAGEQIDYVSVYAALRDNNEADACGGMSYISTLTDGMPHILNVEGYLRILKDKSLRRRIIVSASHMIARAQMETEAVDETLHAFGEAAAQLSGTNDDTRPVSTAQMVKDIGIDALLSPRRHGEVRLPWKRLDSALSGLSGGQIVVVLGETSRGKTSFALQAAAHVGHQGKAVLIWTMEMSPRSLFRRIVTQLSGVPIPNNYTQMTFDDRDRHRMAVAHIVDHPIYFDSRSRSVPAFNASVRQVLSKTPVGLVVVDYLQLIRSNSKQNRTQQVSENSRNLKLAAMDFNIPIMALSQVDRASVKGDGKIGLHSAKEAGDIENDADVLLWIEAKELSREADTPVSVVVGKQREGAAGFGIPMVFRPVSQTFLEVSNED